MKWSDLIDRNLSDTADVGIVQAVPIAQLTVDGGLRIAGEDVAHTHRLMEVVDELPPIIVHYKTMQVIDGVHRLRALQSVGRTAVDVDFFHGSVENAFVTAVAVNVRHGLPLSVADRRTAAMRIVASHPDWSDRRIAAVAGLSARTVTEIRFSSSPRGAIRLGRDGRARPIDSATGRRDAARLLVERPEASLREIARVVGISPETVRNVRVRLARGEDPVPHARRVSSGQGRSASEPTAQPRATPVDRRIAGGPLSAKEQMATLAVLRQNPSVRFSERGRLLLRWLEVSQAAARDWDGILQAIPSHCAQQVANLAKSCAEDWIRLADQVSDQDAGRPGA